MYYFLLILKNKIFKKKSINILSLKKYILKYRNKIILKSTDSESIEGNKIILEYRFTIVTISNILLYDMINIMFLNMMVSF